MKIEYVDRKTGRIEEEKVLGEKYLTWVYSSPVGMGFLELIFKKKVFSYIYGKLQDVSFSKRKIMPFIHEYNINMQEFVKKPQQYKNFNEFFYRELNEQARKIEKSIDRLITPVDGRLLAYQNIDIHSLVQIKGSTYSLGNLIANKNLANDFQHGACIVIRLCPIDYHRFHFPDSGVANKTKEINGDYYSVNPLALKTKALLYCRNKRQLTIFHSENFGDILLIEVGATCVGGIIQTFNPGKTVIKGEEKGYFKFGGSTVIMFLKPHTIRLDEDLVTNTLNGYETKVQMGMGIGTNIKTP